jgi:tryptophan-rich sensory protein
MLISGASTASSIATWYRTLTLPPQSPPGWVFGPVWFTLYTLMAVAAWQVWQQPPSSIRSAALTAYAVQLALNMAWSYIFFVGHRLGWAAVEIVVMWVAIAATTLLFWRLRTSAALMMLPYLAWVGFASFLNIRIWQLNK